MKLSKWVHNILYYVFYECIKYSVLIHFLTMPNIVCSGCKQRSPLIVSLSITCTWEGSRHMDKQVSSVYKVCAID